jgi:predicted AAA+ superfamily ATPase
MRRSGKTAFLHQLRRERLAAGMAREKLPFVSFEDEKLAGISAAKFPEAQGLRISKDTVHELLAHLEDCFLVRTVWIEADSERKRMVNPRKAYPVDPGLIPVFDGGRASDTGRALETAVLIELERRGMTVTYLRTPEGGEVEGPPSRADSPLDARLWPAALQWGGELPRAAPCGLHAPPPRTRAFSRGEQGGPRLAAPSARRTGR